MTYAGARPSDEELTAWYADYPIEHEVSPITRTRLDEIVRSFEPYRRRGAILDVGAGSGHLLDAAVRADWEAHAVEYGPHQRQRLTARGFIMHQPLLEAQDLIDGSFDVVVMQEVIEHMRDPVPELNVVAKVLRPGGLLYLTCPNFASLSKQLLGPRWRVVAYPEHLNYFTPCTLRGLLAPLGLKQVSVATTGISVGDLRAAFQSGDRPSARRVAVDERVREAAERHGSVNALKRTANRILSGLQLGDTIKGRYERTAGTASAGEPQEPLTASR